MADVPEPTLDDVLDERWLRRVAGWRTYERGVAYAEDGRVGPRREIAGGVTAVVDGTRRYAATLGVEGGSLTWTCDCPIGAEGEVCKHVVALAVAHRSDPAPAPAAGAPAPAAGASVESAPDQPDASPTIVPTLTDEDAAAWVRSLEAPELAGLLLDAAAADPILRRRLVEQATAALSTGDASVDLRRAFDHVVRFPIGDRGRPAWGFVEGLDDVIDRMERFLAPGTAATLVGLTEHAIGVMEELLGVVDDSDGDVGTVMERLFDLHLAACRSARPDPVALARRLFAAETRSEWDSFHGAARTYADVLGPEGLAEYRRLIEPMWAFVPALEPGQRESRWSERVAPGQPSRWRVSAIAVQVADLTGDLGERISVRTRDLGSGDRFLDIATVCLEAGEEALAVDWAERGVRAFPDRPGSPLRRFLVERYQAQGRHAEALALSWADFVELPDPERYRRLRADAALAGDERAWRERAIEHARSRIDPRASGAASLAESAVGGWNDWNSDGGASILVRLLLADGEVEAAWATAREHGCRRALWLELAAARSSEHPADAAAVYRREVETLVETKHRGGYAAAAKLALRVVQLESAAGDPGAGQAFLADLRLRHKRKTSLQAELDRALGHSRARASGRR